MDFESIRLKKIYNKIPVNMRIFAETVAGVDQPITEEELQRAAQRAARAGDRESAKELAEAAKKASQELMDYELMQGVFNRIPAEARPGGKYGLIAGFGYAGDYPTKGRVTTPKQFGQKLPGESSPSIRTSGTQRVAGFYNTPGYDPNIDSINRSKGLFPLGNFPEGDDVYYQDILFPEQYGRHVTNHPDQTIMHEFFHRGATMLPLYDLRRYAWKKGDEDSEEVFGKMIAFRDGGKGQHYLLEAVDAYVAAEGDESKLPTNLKSRLDKIEKANEVVREFMTPEKQKELGLRMPLQETKPKKEGMFDRLLK